MELFIIIGIAVLVIEIIIGKAEESREVTFFGISVGGILSIIYMLWFFTTEPTTEYYLLHPSYNSQGEVTRFIVDIDGEFKSYDPIFILDKDIYIEVKYPRKGSLYNKKQMSFVIKGDNDDYD